MGSIKVGYKTKHKKVVKTTTKAKPEKPAASYSFHNAAFKELLVQQQQKIEEGLYVPNQNYDRIRGKDKATPFGAAADLLRGVHNSVSQKKPDNEQDSVALASTIRSKEQKILLKYAKENGMLLDYDKLTAAWEKSGMISGSEHKVTLNKDNTVTKQRTLWANETHYTTLNKIDVHNQVFPETAYTMKGFTEGPTGVSPVYTQPMFVEVSEHTAVKSLKLTKTELADLTSNINSGKVQPAREFITARAEQLYSKATSPAKKTEIALAHEILLNNNVVPTASYDEIVHYMGQKGFKPDLESIRDLGGYKFKDSQASGISIDMDFGDASVHGGDSSRPLINNEHTELIDFLIFRNDKTGMQVRDLAPRNFIRTVSGDIVAVDPMILANAKSQSERIQKELNKLA
jgi:hypothetical protein